MVDTVYWFVFKMCLDKSRLLTLQNFDLLPVFFMLDFSFMLNLETLSGVLSQEKVGFFPLYTKKKNLIKD